jgi:hypothetical protein
MRSAKDKETPASTEIEAVFLRGGLDEWRCKGTGGFGGAGSIDARADKKRQFLSFRELQSGPSLSLRSLSVAATIAAAIRSGGNSLQAPQ